MQHLTWPEEAALVSIAADLIQPGSLSSRLDIARHRAQSKVALVSIPTEKERVPDQNIPFIVHLFTAANAKGKAATLTPSGSAPKRRANPFLPYEQDLYIGHINDHYLCLLNKFNVVDGHFLIVTSQFREQQTLLSEEDFDAALFVLKESPLLIFFNGGKQAGASQRHKHLHAIPLGLADKSQLPLTAIIRPDVVHQQQLDALPFRHRFLFHTGLDSNTLYPRYLECCRQLGLQTAHSQPFEPYNLLLTAEWMLIIPRKQEHFDGISVNALGFAGTLLARDAEQRQYLKKVGPMQILKAVTFQR